MTVELGHGTMLPHLETAMAENLYSSRLFQALP